MAENEMALIGQEEKQAIESIKTQIGALVVNDPASRQTAAGLMGNVATAKKKITAVWKSAVSPYKEKIAIIDGFFKPLIASLDEARAVLDGKVRPDYMAEQKKAAELKAAADAEAEKARIAAEKAREKGQDKKADKLKQKAAVLDNVTPTAPEKTVRGMTGGTLSFKKTWRLVRITDPNLVPDCYWVISEPLIRESVRQGLHEIPGCVIEETVDTSVRG